MILNKKALCVAQSFLLNRLCIIAIMEYWKKETEKMGRALIALIVTLVLGLLGTAFGYDAMNGYSEIGSIVAVAVMGAFIIYFNENNK